MPSPFPGMDPYIELAGDWVGFHNSFIVYASETLNELLPEHYVATLEARIRFHEEPVDAAGERSRRPDISVARRDGPPAAAKGSTSATMLEPVTLAQEILQADETRESFIEIVRVPGERLVTTVELLSPSNKTPGDDRAAYLLKRRQLLHDGVNLVEIDLLLQNNRLPMLQPLPDGDYFAFVSRATERSHCDVYGWSIRHPLPAIPIPLLSGDFPVALDLAHVFAATYHRGRYARLLRYDRPLDLPLATDDHSWATQLAAAARG